MSKLKLKPSTTRRVDPETVREALGAVESPHDFAGRLRGPWVTDATRKELADELTARDQSVARAERERCVRRLREEAADELRLNPGSVMAQWTNRCADLLEREAL